MNKHVTSVSYSDVDFLIQSQYVVSGVYLHIQKDSKNFVFERETLPHLHIGDLLEQTFNCKALEAFSVVLVMNKRDFAPDVCKKIADLTDTAFPASGNLALSLNGAISSKVIDTVALRLLPKGIQDRMTSYGICALSFVEQGRTQLLISPDLLVRKFFSLGLLTGRKLHEENKHS